jgi:hypothetical protein
MKATNVRKAVLLIAAASAFALGCELLVDFDRTKIPAEGGDSATTPEASTPDAADASPEASASDADASSTDASDADTSDAASDADAS